MPDCWIAVRPQMAKREGHKDCLNLLLSTLCLCRSQSSVAHLWAKRKRSEWRLMNGDREGLSGGMPTAFVGEIRRELRFADHQAASHLMALAKAAFPCSHRERNARFSLGVERCSASYSEKKRKAPGWHRGRAGRLLLGSFCFADQWILGCPSMG